MINKTLNRRKALKLFAFGSLALVSAPALKAEDVIKLNKVDPESPQAKALGYVHHYSEVDSERFTRFEEGQICGNCQLVQGDLDNDWVGCGIFPNQIVAREGWCSAWILKR